ncbi:MAG: DUF2099 family protein [Archaeoglobi archaeon]|nr:DUF2099 family protein [Candidatus Mnemosynella bozhongmuii]
MCNHTIMCCGSLVRICDSEIEVLDKPRTRRCPLVRALYGYERIDRDVVKEIVRRKIETKGFATGNREFSSEIRVLFGASEMIMAALEEGLFDCAVVVSEGAGTVITSNGELVQMIGAFLNGIVSTSPVKGIIEKIKENGGIILDERSAEIDQAEGVRTAFQKGFRRIAVTVAGFRSQEIAEIRKIEKELSCDITVFTVCTTRATEEDEQNLMLSDLIWSCNSRIVRERIAKKSIFQIGVSIPVFALTEKGKRVILNYLMKSPEKFVAFRTELPYLVKERSPE